MPIYEYKCKNCNTVFEKFQSIGSNSENLVCPECGAPRPERIFSAFAAKGTSVSTSGGSGCGSGGHFT